jgi:hypothetical protein
MAPPPIWSPVATTTRTARRPFRIPTGASRHLTSQAPAPCAPSSLPCAVCRNDNLMLQSEDGRSESGHGRWFSQFRVIDDYFSPDGPPQPPSLDSTSGDFTLPASSSAPMVALMSCHSAGPVSFRSSSLLLSSFICKQSQALAVIAIVLRAQVEVRGARTREVERGELYLYCNQVTVNWDAEMTKFNCTVWPVLIMVYE